MGETKLHMPLFLQTNLHLTGRLGVDEGIRPRAAELRVRERFSAHFGDI